MLDRRLQKFAVISAHESGFVGLIGILYEIRALQSKSVIASIGFAKRDAGFVKIVVVRPYVGGVEVDFGWRGVKLRRPDRIEHATTGVNQEQQSEAQNQLRGVNRDSKRAEKMNEGK